MSDVKKEQIINFLEKLLIWGIYFYCVSFPFSIAASQIGVMTSLVSWIIISISKKEFVFKKNIMNLPILIFLYVQLVSTFFSIDYLRSVHEFRSYWHVFIFFIVVNRCDAKTVRNGIYLMVASVSAASLVGIGQYVYSRFIVTALREHRVSGTIGMYMTYSGILMMISIITFAVFAYGGLKNKTRFLFIGAFLLIILALVASLTRSAWIGFVAGIAGIAIVKDRRLLIYLTIALVLAGFLLPKDARERAKQLINGPKMTVKDGVVVSGGDERIYLWKSGIEVIKHNLLFGAGLQNYELTYPKYLPYKPKRVLHHAHNNFIHLGAETGILGFLAFTAMLLIFLVYIIKKVISSPRDPKSFEKSVVIGILGAFIAFIIAGLFEYNFGDSEVQMLLWFLMAASLVFTGKLPPSREV